MGRAMGRLGWGGWDGGVVDGKLPHCVLGSPTFVGSSALAAGFHGTSLSIRLRKRMRSATRRAKMARVAMRTIHPRATAEVGM